MIRFTKNQTKKCSDHLLIRQTKTEPMELATSFSHGFYCATICPIAPEASACGSRRDRTGALLIAVFACLAISLSLVFSSLALSLRSQRETKSIANVYQTAFLLDAGIERAIDQLQRSDDYQGEIWKPTFANGSGTRNSTSDCSIEIHVDRKDSASSRENFKIDVTARVESSDASNHPVQQTRQFKFKIPKT